MPVNEKEFVHVRLHRANAEKLMKITAQTRRSINLEANIAVEQYVPNSPSPQPSPHKTKEYDTEKKIRYLKKKNKHENKTSNSNPRPVQQRTGEPD